MIIIIIIIIIIITVIIITIIAAVYEMGELNYFAHWVIFWSDVIETSLDKIFWFFYSKDVNQSSIRLWSKFIKILVSKCFNTTSGKMF